MSDSHRKSILKSISWRIIASLITLVLVFIYTKDFTMSLEIGFLEFFLKMLVYYIHERFWLGIKN